MDPSELSAEDFFKRWRQIGAGNMEAQSSFPLKSGGSLNLNAMRGTVGSLGWKVLKDVDPKEENVVGCAVWQKEGGKVGCLCRVEPGLEQKVIQPKSIRT
jgi:AP-2 complex subunit alpha